MNKVLLSVMVLLTITSCKKEKDTNTAPQAIVVAGSGDITVKVNEFRNLLGAVINTTPGHTDGRREINWDAVPDAYIGQKLPSDFFNPIDPGAEAALQRGFVYSPDVDARISKNSFTDLEASNGTEFSAFSGAKTFSAVSNNLWNVDFEIPGQRVTGSINGFGAVFSDVDDASSTAIEYFSGNKSLGVYKVPVRTAGTTHSFLGVYFPYEKVTRLRIIQGGATVANGVKDVSAGGAKDLVIMDDFLYDEPQPLQ
jgi:hypothetical protein